MTNANQKFDLQQMWEYFENEARNVRTISDYDLSETDYKSLGTKLRGMLVLEANQNWMDDFILLLLVFCSYSFIYEGEKERKEQLRELEAHLNQHQIRHYLTAFMECIHDYGFVDYGYDAGDIRKDFIQTIARQAGIPNREKYQVFDLIEKFEGYTTVDELVFGVCSQLPVVTRQIFACLDQASCQQMICEIRSLLIAVKKDKMTRAELLKAFPESSISLIDYCVFWQENKVMNRYVRQK